MGPSYSLRVVRCLGFSSPWVRLSIGNIAGTRIPLGARRFSPIAASRHSTFRASPRLLQGPAIEERVGKETESSTRPNDVSSDANGPDVPWYLQVEPPRHPTLLHEPPPLPDVPDGSPKLMQPLLEFVSDELGMDGLTLLDLRAMDPPPALGSDLLMIFGTARSERHLHVSADRLVRWLRARGITASADGLIGRNELKLKLRRMARKAKLLGNSGVARGGDDGISTGWICVNLGSVGGSHQEISMVDEEGRPTGFGVPDTGTTIVVQLLTESRRNELDLETLWRNKLQKNLRKQGLLSGNKMSSPGLATGDGPTVAADQHSSTHQLDG
ncbi:ATPase synthesis protein 25, mitochondrial [Madurella mycetomatis]|uniref:ATPase synthesis protein 25 n=1 Tax=Madurella mycetomatis TaxID=100816 RepID=A0A175VPA6_9PEZI|nr:ATPase synthesis protein 25, mitochondrial [Madurella mycetomatis]